MGSTANRRYFSKTANILGFIVNIINLEETVTLLEKQLLLHREKREKARIRVVTINPEMLMMGLRDSRLATAINRGDLVVPDGIGVVWALRLAGNKRQQRVTGVDLVEKLLARPAATGLRVYLLGGKPDVVATAANQLANRWPNVKVVGFHHGYFAVEENPQLIAEINRLEPELLLVGMGVPQQEIWLDEQWSKLAVSFGIGIGGLFDLWAGRTLRAPYLLRKIGLEWAYRACKEPQRWKRLRILPEFIWRVWTGKSNVS